MHANPCDASSDVRGSCSEKSAGQLVRPAGPGLALERGEEREKRREERKDPLFVMIKKLLLLLLLLLRLPHSSIAPFSAGGGEARGRTPDPAPPPLLPAAVAARSARAHLPLARAPARPSSRARRSSERANYGTTLSNPFTGFWRGSVGGSWPERPFCASAIPCWCGCVSQCCSSFTTENRIITQRDLHG